MPPRERLVEASVKPIEPAEIEMLARWIAAGAPEVAVAPDVATTTPDPLVTDKDRDFWAFRPPQPVAVPAVRDAARVRNPIDAFVLQKLEEKGLTLSPEADRADAAAAGVLRPDRPAARAGRGAGLPRRPRPGRLRAADRPAARVAALRRALGPLLARPGRLRRLARASASRTCPGRTPGATATTSSARSTPTSRTTASCSNSSPATSWPTTRTPPEITPELYDNLVATGFLRMAPDATWANITGFVPDRLEVIADEIDVLGSAVMGLTLKCARCHSHKFDPIPQRDYYRLVAVFKGAFDEHDWLKPDVRPGIGPVSQDTQPRPASAARHDRGARCLGGAQRADREGDRGSEGARPQGHRAQVKALRGTAAAGAADPGPVGPRRAVADLHLPPRRSAEPGPAGRAGRAVGADRRQDAVRGDAALAGREEDRPAAGVRPLADAAGPPADGARDGQPALEAPLRHRHRHDARQLRQGRRAADASRAARLAGRGVRRARAGASRRMHRLMMTSATYRQSSAVTPEQEKLDPDNALLSRMPLVRLDAEALYDTLLLVAGRLDETRVRPGATRWRCARDGLVTPAGTTRGWRRLIYVQQTRKQLPTHLENFDFPQMNPNCLERRDSPSPRRRCT